MRAYPLPFTLLALSSLSHSQLVPLSSPWSRQSANELQQARIMADTNAPSIQLPPSSDGDPPPPPPKGDVIISDVIGNTRQINIFAGFTRDIDTISSRLDDSSKNSTILAPVNSAVSALPRKPWEDPRDYAVLGANAYEGKDGEDRAHRNLRRFTEAHVVPESPWQKDEKVKSLGGSLLWWEVKDDGKAYVQPGNVEVERVASRVGNGEVWVLKGVLNYAS
ncbi:hypothetical protein CERZMDRAFT_89521 [Cercospora zeae-maydis SCOH1-5]|uniref:FAS1 domain-containing protein n=1 Tax=Cercospora zeae-maydis SCOH1-5 TaxID=717836 RepID=A0A6A6FV99_9PEZI|nr:hypothetical protein CERZMDRAFT_89521 [Cercospora zeae-maydis SCOH1-5]